MTSVRFLRTCFVSACANTLFLRDSHPLNVDKAAAVAPRTTRCNPASPEPWRHRRRRRCAAPATPYRRRRTSCAAYYPDSLRKASLSFSLPKPGSRQPETPRRSPRGRAHMEHIIPLQNSMEDAMLRPAPSPVASPVRAPPAPHPISRLARGDEMEPRRFPEDFVPPSPSPSETRSTRSGSTASRTNRLSLTLPIAPPTAYPSRPTPASTTATSFPPTPLDTPALASPMDSGDFITAIAAQERRVLELREELSRAESDLTRLKKQWATHEAYKKRAEKRNVEPLRLIPSVDLQDDIAARRSVELDRRKAVLLAQQGQQNTPEKGRRRVFRGAHTRTLSLLSPTKPTSGFSVHEDGDAPSSGFEEPDSPYVNRYAPINSAQLAKRASWAPRSTIQPTGIKQVAQDFKQGLWTFMEDIRQATVGEEPITGQRTYLRGSEGDVRAAISGNTSPLAYGDQDTIRASGANSRPRVTTAFDETPAVDDQPEKENGTAPQTRGHTRSNTEGTKTLKRFSWTPLTMDSYDDNDWSNWDSPNVGSTRWSGTTVNGDIIPSIPEKHDENDTPLKNKSSKTRLSGHASPTANKLEELLPPVLNQLTPSNLKRATSNLMKEWEKSLYPQSEYPTTVGVKDKGP
ncbi:hypothetical protein QBC47DRAFT_7294 [Echria macrotheca]|uniref:DUF4048 domain-containing protein n=1 Tax=Echria macrotheca TaxID=438768 RepID=A0AAJ0BLJ0_9PEZI|nr:hypothetical protein QBC47DRAFT_7294 [Echria macrotheca]